MIFIGSIFIFCGIALAINKKNTNQKNLDRIIANRCSGSQKGQLTLSKNKVNSTRDFNVLIIKGDPNQ